jgi:hypothetical protein
LFFYFKIIFYYSFQDEPLSIDCGVVVGSSATPTSLLSTTSQWMNDANDEERFATTLDVDAIKVRNETRKRADEAF